MCSRPCESELTCLRPESNRGPYWLLKFLSATLSTTELWWRMNHRKSFRTLFCTIISDSVLIFDDLHRHQNPTWDDSNHIFWSHATWLNALLGIVKREGNASVEWIGDTYVCNHLYWSHWCDMTQRFQGMAVCQKIQITYRAAKASYAHMPREGIQMQVAWCGVCCAW